MRNPRSRNFYILFVLLTVLTIASTQLSSIAFSPPKTHSENIDSWATIIKEDKDIDNPIMRVVNNCIYIAARINWYDTYIVKYSNSGIKLWEYIWKGPDREFVKCFITDSENNLYITGITDPQYPREGDIFLLKFNNSGALLWSKVFNPFPNSSCSMLSLQIGSNNSFYISGVLEEENLFLLQLDLSGEIMWNRQIIVNKRLILLETQIDSENSLYIFYWDFELNSTLIKYNQFGSPQWNKTWDNEIIPGGWKIDKNDNVLITGLNLYQNVSLDIWAMKINQSGLTINTTKIEDNEIVWEYSIWDNFAQVGLLDGSTRNYKWFFDYQNNIYIYLRGRNSNAFLYKIDSNLKYQWKCSLEISRSIIEFRCDTYQTIHFVCGVLAIYSRRQNTEISIMNINSSGNITLTNAWGGPYVDFLNTIEMDSQNNLYMISTSAYSDQWSFFSFQTILVKNPQLNRYPPSINIKLGYYDYYLFSFIGIMCIISISMTRSLVKQKIKKKV